MSNALNQYPKLILPTGSQYAPYPGHDADGNLTSEYGTLGGDSDCSTFVDFNDINYFVAALAGGTGSPHVQRAVTRWWGGVVRETDQASCAAAIPVPAAS